MINEHQLRDRHSEVSDELRRQIKSLEQTIRNYRQEHGKLELFFASLNDSITAIPQVPILYKKAGNIKVDSICSAVVHISDTHMGAVQMPDEIEGFNEYNPEICKDRCMRYVQKVQKWNELHRMSYRVDECHVIVTGDLISGDIHDELRITNAFPSTVQVAEAGALLAQQVTWLAPHFNKVIVHFLVEDNHSRLTKKPQAKEAGLNSMNYLVGHIARLHLKDQKNVDFRMYPQLEKVVAVSTRRYLTTHGHVLKSWMGHPWYDVIRKVGKESTARMALLMDEAFPYKQEVGFHKLLHAHFHTPVFHPQFICNGSTQGTDAYDHQAGRHGDPSQSSWYVHPKWGEFDYTPFNLK